MVKSPPASAGSIPAAGRPPWRRAWPPTPVFVPGESHGQRSLEGYSLWGHTDRSHTYTLTAGGREEERLEEG